MQQMMLHPWLHQAEHVLYLGGGYLFLLPLLGDEPIRWRPPYLVRLIALFIAMAPETVVGIVLLQANHELFPAYAEIHRMWGPTPLQDLNRGGGIMWAFGDGLMMVFIVGVMLAYITHASTNATAGGWLEGVRRSTLADNLAATGGHSELGDVDLDEDEAALSAYNRMLGRLNERDPG
jgi:cytochrome c oxidase assembly factor CtaG